MKKVILSLGAFLAITTASAQHLAIEQVPASVTQAFAKQYPTSKVEVWEKEGNDYEAEFHLNKVESSAVFGANGSFKELEQEIKIAQLPKVAIIHCGKTYVGYKLTEAAKITDVDGIVTYEAEMTSKKKHFDVIFNDKGTFVKKTETSTEVESKDEVVAPLKTNNENPSKLELPK